MNIAKVFLFVLFTFFNWFANIEVGGWGMNEQIYDSYLANFHWFLIGPSMIDRSNSYCLYN